MLKYTFSTQVTWLSTRRRLRDARLHNSDDWDPLTVVSSAVARIRVRTSAMAKQINQVVLYVSSSTPFRGGVDRRLIRAAMVLTFFAFSIQKWNPYTSEMLVPLISHSPVVFWLLPAFGVRGAGYFLGTSEMIFGMLILLGYGARSLESWARLGRSTDW
jgi:hypothetical protein